MDRMLSKEEASRSIELVLQGMKKLKPAFKENVKDSIVSMDVWDWSQGVGLFAQYLYYKETGRKDIQDELVAWFDRHLAKGLPGKNVNTMCPLLTMSYLGEELGREDYLDVCREWAQYAFTEMPRTTEGGISHITVTADNEGQLWDDTLYMTVLFLGRMGVLLGRDDYVQESVRQFLVHLKYLTDVRTGLFFHGWTFLGNHHFGEALWGRGNAWYAAGLVDYLDIVPVQPGVAQFLLTSLERQTQALVPLQTEEGMWRTLLDQPDSYPESSATAGFAYGIMKAVRKGYLSERYLETGRKAMRAVMARVDEDGLVQGVSYGTCVGDELDYYRGISVCPMPYGQAMTLLMLVESMKHPETAGVVPQA
ncbi:glycoside hydrolase family 88/105 protein [Paenibacillus sacheonensis]|uniref:Glycoside hydrolase family 105 protein n=1 Tax=Paenibacillus sacheonensis TaxID=742054 RepID=A0A7X5BYZ5_9BACL|nr:glycoside hydrolase family 88 protein [Paenibacillus sacheonensis]MBM7565283.1 unsaturated rhamnogalacturonyl hydrolase [Paenibacillus sacheonensis]NBC69946.1 glycoside hydrolase family 105 protein [Paenibacillus sacheonensis]